MVGDPKYPGVPSTSHVIMTRTYKRRCSSEPMDILRVFVSGINGAEETFIVLDKVEATAKRARLK